MKKTAIALAVATLAAAPLAAQAGAGAYASVRIGVDVADNGTTDSTTIHGFASRLGFKGETDLGNGMTGFGKYEFGIGTEGAAANVSRRHALVGVKGGFGSITLGQTYHTYYNHVIGPVDLAWWGNNQAISYTGRTDQALSYAGDFGAASVGATVYMDDSSAEDVDGTEFAVSFDAGPVRIGVGVQDMEVNADSSVGVALKGDLGPVSLSGNFITMGDDTDLHIFAGFGNAYLDFGQADFDATNTSPTGVTLGYTHSVGPQTTMWFEAQTKDPDTGADNSTNIRAVLKYDWK